MATIKAVLKSTARKTDATHLVMLRLTRHRKAVYIGLSIYVPQAHWNPKGKLEKADWVAKKNALWREFNASIKEEWLKLDRLQLEHPLLSAAQLKSRHLQQGEEDLMAFFRRTLEEIRREVSPNTAATYASGFKLLEAFTGGFLKEVSLDFVRRYEAHLLQGEEGKARKRNSVALYLSQLRTLVRRAVAAGLIPHAGDPFLRFTLKRGKVIKDRLTAEEIGKLLSYRAAGGVELARRVFLVQFFLSGMRVSDVLLMRWEQVKGDRLEYRSQKTHALLSVKIPAPALALLGPRSAGYVFPFLSEGQGAELQRRLLASARTALNRDLKTIAAELKLGKVLSTHVARHSFASLAWEKTGNLKGVQQALGHSKLAMTENYLRQLTHSEQDAVAAAVFGGFGTDV